MLDFLIEGEELVLKDFIVIFSLSYGFMCFVICNVYIL